MNKNKKKIFYIIVILFICINCIFCFSFLKRNNFPKENIDSFLAPSPFNIESSLALSIPATKIVKTNNKQKLEKLIAECWSYKSKLLAIPYINHKTKQNIKKEIRNIDSILEIYENKYENILEQERIAEENRIKEEEKKRKELHLLKCSQQYPIATTIWKYLKNLGYNDYICAGILGNMMAEAGGQTLNIQPYLLDESEFYYGICQWSKEYHPQAYGTELDFQLNYLYNTIQKEFNVFGHLYYSGFSYTSFLNLDDASAAALAFAKVYERCGSQYYNIRQRNAIKAYNYFVYY